MWKARRAWNRLENSLKAPLLVTLLLLAAALLAACYLYLQRRKLLAQRERSDLLIWATQDGLFDYDVATDKIFLTPRWKAILGYQPDELESTLDALKNHLHPDDKSAAEAALQSYLRSGHGTCEIEYRLRHKDGSWRWILARAQAVWDHNGRATRLVGSHSDTTEQKAVLQTADRASELQITAANDLRRAQEQVAEAHAQAEDAARAKNSFLATMSYEIRTPMNAVIGMTNLMLDGPLSSSQRSQADTIRSSGQVLLEILNDILDFSKIEAGKVVLDSIEFDLHTLLEESAELVTASATANTLQISLNIEAGVPFSAVGDPVRLRRILLNLLSYAIQLTERGSVELSVACATEMQAAEALRFTIRDTGVGIRPGQEPAILEAFPQADRSATRQFGGTGLGLSIVKRLVELMGGTIGLTAKPGEGTTFWFQIALPAGTTLETAVFPKRRVLLLEGDKPSLAMGRRYLERAGMQVQCLSANCGEEPAPTLLIVDTATLKNPAKIELIRDSPILSNVAILALGDARDLLPADLERLPDISAYVPKPVRCVPLLRAVQAILRGESDKAVRSPPVIEAAEILVVEDNRINQMVVTLLLQKLGCRVDVARNGHEACAAVKLKSYALVLMDCQMPEMDGFEATRKIRSTEIGSRRTPIVALTAGVLKEEREQCFAAGMDAFLAKPISYDALETTLQDWLAPGSLLQPENTAAPP